MLFYMCVQEDMLRAFSLLPLLFRACPALCKIIFHLSHVDYNATNLDNDKQGIPLQNTMWPWPTLAHIHIHSAVSLYSAM